MSLKRVKTHLSVSLILNAKNGIKRTFPEKKRVFKRVKMSTLTS